MLEIKTFTCNPVQENSYILHDETGEAIIVDAGFFYDAEKQKIKDYITDNQLKLVRVINTHLHFDHQFGNKFLYDTYGLKPEAHPEDEFLLAGIKAKARIFGFPMQEDAQELGAYIYEDQEIKFGNTTLKTLFVPGHTPGHLAFYSEKDKAVLVGDVLFKGSIGRTDLERGDYATLIRSITNKLLVLPDDTVVYSGHGPTTTIGDEKLHNPYL